MNPASNADIPAKSPSVPTDVAIVRKPGRNCGLEIAVIVTLTPPSLVLNSYVYTPTAFTVITCPFCPNTAPLDTDAGNVIVSVGSLIAISTRILLYSPDEGQSATVPLLNCSVIGLVGEIVWYEPSLIN